jgi:uridine kinase
MEQHVQTILRSIKQTDPPKRPYIIAIDGRCGAGKSTIAARLAEELNATLFHMDDFFLRPEQRTPERFSTPGENVDHERFLKEILIPLKEGRTITYSPYSCTTQTLLDPITVTPADFVIVEGSYALHPTLRAYYDLRVFLTLFPREQEARIRARNGDAIWPMFKNRWIPMEEAYHIYWKVEKFSDLILWTDN